jgi:methionyl-tRNA formyltransferase
MKNRIIFLGSSDFAVPILSKLNEEYQIVLVITQPDRPAGRGGIIETSPVKKLTLSLRLPILQPERIKESSFILKLKDLNADLMIVAAYGQILSKPLLDLPPYGCINVHASLLPRWRGASPIQAALLAGDSVSGVSIMQMDEGLDTGPILSQKEVIISDDEDALSLSVKLSALGADLLMDTLNRFFLGQLEPWKQDDEKATKSQLIKKEDGLLDLNKSAELLERMVRAYYPWPGAHFFWSGNAIKVLKAHVNDNQTSIAGEHKTIDKKPALGAEKGYLVLDLLQPAGKNPMTGKEFLNGARNWLN